MAASMLMLYLGGQKDERRYQSESYEMLEQNTTDFNKIFGRADGFVRNLTASLGSPRLVRFGQSGGNRCLLPCIHC